MNSNNNKKRTFREELRLISRGFKTLISIDKSYILIITVKEFADNILPFVNLYMSALIITAISKSEDFKKLILYALITVSINLTVKVIQNLIAKQYTVCEDILWKRIGEFYNEANSNMQYEHLENPDVYVHRHRIHQRQNEGGKGIINLAYQLDNAIDNIFSLIFSAALTAGMFAMRASGDFKGVFAFVNSPFSCVVIIFMLILNTSVSIILGKRKAHKQFNLTKVFDEQNKSYWYFSDLINGGGKYTYGMDIRLFNQKML